MKITFDTAFLALARRYGVVSVFAKLQDAFSARAALPLIRGFAICMLATVSALAQPQPLASIDVKPARLADLQSRRIRVLSNGYLRATSVNVISLITEGYRVPANPSHRLSTLPPWVYSERYDITAKPAAGAKPLSPSDRDVTKLVHDIFRQVLADKFHLAIRVENKSMPVYALIIAEGGSKMKRSHVTGCVFDDAPDGCHNFVIGFGHPLNAKTIDMDDLAHYIENWTDMPVINRTALSGLYTVRTEGWRPMRLPPPPPNGNGNVDFSRLPTLDMILRELGLKLHRLEAVVPIYTVEHIDRPATE